MTLEQQTRGMVLGAFIGDALALGPHWVYDRAKIVAQLGRVTSFHAPMTTYHPGKVAGDYTHLGDQMLVLQRSLAGGGGVFDSAAFFAQWLAFWRDPTTKSYQDKATRTVLANVAAGKGAGEAASTSEELAGPVRGMPLLAQGLAKGLSEADLIAAMQEQTALTHHSAAALEVAAFLARLGLAVVETKAFESALQKALAGAGAVVRDSVGKAESPSLTGLGSGEVVEALGQSCDLAAALPASIWLMRKYGHSFEEALIENVMAGGDSAARGILMGAVLGCLHGEEAMPEAWRTRLRQSPL